MTTRSRRTGPIVCAVALWALGCGGDEKALSTQEAGEGLRACLLPDQLDTTRVVLQIAETTWPDDPSEPRCLELHLSSPRENDSDITLPEGWALERVQAYRGVCLRPPVPTLGDQASSSSGEIELTSFDDNGDPASLSIDVELRFDHHYGRYTIFRLRTQKPRDVQRCAANL